MVKSEVEEFCKELAALIKKHHAHSCGVSQFTLGEFEVGLSTMTTSSIGGKWDEIILVEYTIRTETQETFRL